MNTVRVPDILLPRTDIPMETWAVNACDQFTSNRKYWAEVERLTEGKHSAYNLIFPEIYLSDNPAGRIAAINEHMRAYLDEGVFRSVHSMALVERTTESGTRHGIVLCVDLEDYSFESQAKTLIRATEATILSRIPPRVAIRKDAPIELPHAMLLYDDEQHTVRDAVRRGEMLYDFDLMLGGGHVRAYTVANPQDVIFALYGLCGKEHSLKRYGTEQGILFAVGDGNHSIATAKACWDNLKCYLSPKERENHPQRYVLCEIVNVFDDALKFGAIHRLMACAGIEQKESFIEGLKQMAADAGGKETAYIITDGTKTAIPFNADIPQGIRDLDRYIERCIAADGGAVDFVHGEEELTRHSTGNSVGVLLPAIDKDDFFRLIVHEGTLPRKTFSMGEGHEKRYYIEARAIR